MIDLKLKQKQQKAMEERAKMQESISSPITPLKTY